MQSEPGQGVEPGDGGWVEETGQHWFWGAGSVMRAGWWRGCGPFPTRGTGKGKWVGAAVRTTHKSVPIAVSGRRSWGCSSGEGWGFGLGGARRSTHLLDHHHAPPQDRSIQIRDRAFCSLHTHRFCRYDELREFILSRVVSSSSPDCEGRLILVCSVILTFASS
jgi:hypothetical protein